MVKNKNRNRVGGVNIIPGKEVVQQYQLLVCNIMIYAIKEVVKPFAQKRKVWKLKKDPTRVDFEDEFLAQSRKEDGSKEVS